MRFRLVTVQEPPGTALAARLGIDPVMPETNAVILVAWRLYVQPLRRWRVPRAVCFERGDADRFVLKIDAGFPSAGPVVHYRGWLLPLG